MLRIVVLIFTLTWGFSEVCAQVLFEDVAASSGIDHYSPPHPFAGFMTGGAAWLDYDNDGWEDFYLTSSINADRLYRNNQDGTFTDMSGSSGIENFTSSVTTMGVSAGDLNRDGFTDLVVTTDLFDRNLVFMNNGDGTFSEEGSLVGIDNVSFSFGVSLGDYDEDGWLDIYFANWVENSLQQLAYPDRLYHNNGDGTFEDVTVEKGLFFDNGCGLAPSFTDYDLDGDIDLLVGNDFGFWSWTMGNTLYENDNGSFTDVSIQTGFGLAMNSMSMVSGDYDEDQDYDYYITNINGNALARNDVGQFMDVAESAGVQCEWNVIDTSAHATYAEGVSWGAAFLDYDNDTYLDLFVASGKLSPFQQDSISIYQNRLYQNLNASGLFNDVSVAAGVASPGINKGCAMADYDHDGDMDMLVVEMDTLGGSGRTRLMKNSGGIGNWLQVSLAGTESNKDAIGTTIYVYVDGRTFLREVDSGGSSYLSHHSKVIHFGLGTYAQVDSVSIAWPNSAIQTIINVEANQRLSITEESSVPVFTESYDSEKKVSFFPNPADHSIYVENNSLYDAEIFIQSVSGQLVYSGKLSGNQKMEIVDLKALPSGSYVIQFINSEFNHFEKLFLR